MFVAYCHKLGKLIAKGSDFIDTLNEKQLLRTGNFSSPKKLRFYLLLRFIDQRGEPAGCGVLREDFLKFGIDCSTATIGRYLKELDFKDYTVQNSNLGRVLTPSGKAYLRDMNERLERAMMQSELSKNVKVTNYDELEELLLARRALEAEAARLAALNATDEELNRLMEAVQRHKQTVQRNEDPTETALQFHTVVAEISGNRFVISILNMLVYEEKKIESKMDALVTRERGRLYVVEHEEIAKAICSHNADLAKELMNKHLTVLCDAVVEQEDLMQG